MIKCSFIIVKLQIMHTTSMNNIHLLLIIIRIVNIVLTINVDKQSYSNNLYYIINNKTHVYIPYQTLFLYLCEL